MEPWSLSRYRRPHLKVDAIDLVREKTVAIAAGTSVYRFECDSTSVAVRVATELGTLRDPESPMWDVVRGSKSDSGWGIIGVFLDERSLIAEARDTSSDPLIQKANQIATRTKQAAAAFVDQLPSPIRDRVRSKATAFLEKMEFERSTGKVGQFGWDISSAALDENFFLAVLGIEFSYMRRCAPVALVGSTLWLAEVAGANDLDLKIWSGLIVEDVGWYYACRDYDASLCLVETCILRSIDRTSARFSSPSIPKFRRTSGLEFLREAELAARAALLDWGPNKYVQAITTLEDFSSPLVAGCYVEEYHVTRRFVEIITPMLRKRLAEPLRALMFRYYSEEIGHEEFERSTCETLGVTQDALNLAVPLPLHLAFVDALIESAEQHPIAFLAVIMITEGMLGDESVISERLSVVGSKHQKFLKMSQRHDALNRDLHHASIARLAFEQIEAIGPAAQEQAFRWVMFLLELNHRAWDALADFYAPQESLHLPTYPAL